VRRNTIEPWESEARDATERLRQALAALAAQETALAAGTVDRDQFSEGLTRTDRIRESVDEWRRDWSVRTDNIRTSRAVALAVFRGCLPPLVGAVDIYSQSLTILALSPDPDGGDGDLAGQGIRAAKLVALSTLQFLDDTPVLRPVDRAAVDATLTGLETQSTSLIALVERIGSRVRALRSEGGCVGS
jgi:hypothetical protein